MKIITEIIVASGTRAVNPSAIYLAAFFALVLIWF